jgi:predicted metalloprotease with PDZ domain
VRLRGFFDRALRSTQALSFAPPLKQMGLQMQLRPAESWADRGGKVIEKRPDGPAIAIGARIAEDPMGAKVTHVLENGAAQAAGLAAGDVIVALDALKVNGKNLEQRLNLREPGGTAHLHFFRRDELHRTELNITPAPADTCALSVSKSDRGAAARRASWLGTRQS